jgi:hypothetical protein
MRGLDVTIYDPELDRDGTQAPLIIQALGEALMSSRR